MPPPIRRPESVKLNLKKSLQNPLEETQKEILIEVDSEYQSELANKIKTHFDTKQLERIKDGKIHISDLTYCLRKALITVQNQDKVENSIYDYTNFMDGLDSEKVIVDILSNAKGVGETEYQKDINFFDFTAHPDYIENSVIYELKATNKNQPLILSDDVLKSYINQIVYYMVLLDMEKGKIIVRYNLPYFLEYLGKDELNEPVYKLKFHKDTKEFPFFVVRLTIPKDAKIRSIVKDALTTVIKPLYLQGDITKIPVLDNKQFNWKCGYCKVRDICDTIPDKQYDTNIRDIILNKHIGNASNKVRRYGRKKVFEFNKKE